MRKTTLSNTENIRSADAFVFPPTTASTSSMPRVAFGGESSNSGMKAGDRALASLWIRRLKPREESDSLKGETFVSDIEMRQGLHAANSDPDSSTHPVRSHLQEASSRKTWANKPFSKIRKLDEVLKNALNEQISSSEQQDYGGSRQQNLLKQERGRVVPLATPYTRGSGQQINDAKPEWTSPTKLMTVDMNANSRCTSEAAMISYTCRQAADSNSPFLHAVKVQAAEAGILTSSLGKPPLPPSHLKAGLPPRPAGHKSSSLSARSAGKISSSPTNNTLAAVPLQDIARHPSHIADTKESLLATKASTGPLLKEGRRAKEDGMGCQDPLSKENGMCIEAIRALPCTQVDRAISVSHKVVPSFEPGMQQLPVSHNKGKSSSLTSKPPKKIARQDFEAKDVIASGTESLKNLNCLETGEQASCTFLKEPKTLSECSVVSSQADETMEAAPSASTTARFPWEMFAGAAGPSRSAREEFVEVYNRARNELKNQKSSSSVTKVFYKEMENHAGRCLPDTSNVKREGQTSDRQQQPELPEKLSKVDGVDCISQQGRVKVTATNAQISQKGLFSEKRSYASFLEVACAGDVDINPGKKSEAFQSVHVTRGKESSSFMQGRCGGPLHGCVEPPAAGQKDRSSTLEKNSHRQGFASNSTPEGAASTHRELFQPTLVDKTDGHVNSKRQPGMSDSSPSNKKTLMLLSKRQLGMFDSSESLQRTTLPRKSDVWLQRWYPPYITRIKGSQEHKLPESDRHGQDLAGSSAGNMLRANESDEYGACAKEDLKRRLIEKGVLYQRIMAGAEPKQLKASSKKVLPSAAAMAIVGTAARQFCTVQPRQVRSFAFWSDFRMPAPQTPEHCTEKGKRKHTFKADPSEQP